MTVRARLLLGLVMLATIGLVLAGAITYRQVQADMLSRIDGEARNASNHPAIFFKDFRQPPGTPTPAEVILPPGTWSQVREAGTGRVIVTNSGVLPGMTPPEVPANIVAGARFTVSSPHYRVAVASSPSSYDVGGPVDIDAYLVVAIPLNDVDQTMHHLLVVEFFVITGVLLTLALLAWWVVNLGLRPLREMEATAGAIAKGDLSQRVDVVDEHTEVGRLGIALNEMLQQIQTAFDERTRSEARLRRFVADASHELRTPLTSIRGYAELFRRGAADRPEDLAKAMRRIEEEAGRMGVLVDDLLLLARLDSGRPLEHQPVDLTRITGDAVDDARVTAPNRPIDFTSEGTIVVPGDEVRLRQVLGNLLQNANRYTPPTSPVHVSVTTDGDDAVITVADEGPGMDPDEASRVFERFYRADPSRTRASGGAGLGLAIVAAIAENHGGSAAVETSPGQGATFFIRLPRTAPVVPPEPAPNGGPPPGVTIPITELEDSN